MAALVHGRKNSTIIQGEESGAVDRYGISTVTRVEEIPSSLLGTLLRPLGQTHPSYSNMELSKATWNLGNAGKFYRVTYTYEGFIGSLPDPTYELAGSLSQEPIQTHKTFESFAGTAADPLNGAIFIDPVTQKPTTSDPSVWKEFGNGDKMGVDSYMSPSVTWTEVSFSTTRPTSLRELGYIDMPSGPNPSMSGRNWLLWDYSYRKRGRVFESRLTWKMSDRKGWDADIYGTATA